MNRIEYSVTAEDIGNRLDKYLSLVMEDISRAHIQKWVQKSLIEVNDKTAKANQRLKLGDVIVVMIPDPEPVAIVPVEMDLDIVYEDDDLMVINKPAGMVVHPAPGHYDDTLVNGIMAHCGDRLSGINGELRPGIVHRIDKDTTGLLVVCKNDKAHQHLAAQLKAHTVERVYEAIVFNNVSEEEGKVDKPIGRHQVRRKEMSVNYKNGRDAVTHYKVITRLKNGFTHIELRLETGRTHQIRVHMTSIGHPLLGDPLYGPKNSPFKLPGQMLHARTLGFEHPSTGEWLTFTTERPHIFDMALQRLSK